ncbi:Cyclin-dependent protein kinase inhibitor SMR14 [Cardamine amara subsp. amara]|uniref:Cyclin-dependent protein kinase inhibitor SMR14 n=1 Tax=Cardamine amara subsp. amara TaxID=228776 RepID=A0ABD1BBR2_CARAN
MSNVKIFHLFPDDKDIATMQQPESFLVPSKSDSPDSSLSPHHQENQSRKQRNFEQEEKQEKQEKLQDGSRGKRKWECDDEASRVDIHETPRKSNIVCYCVPRPPRKPKAMPAMKRRAMWVKRSVVFLDVAREVESMFPPSLLQDFGNKIKKARS